jgi:Reverse transcriptase (RNA-dependent DNA polymerase)
VIGGLLYQIEQVITITFRTILPDVPVEPLPDAARACKAEAVLNPSKEAPRVLLLNAAAFFRACKLEGSRWFQLNLAEPEPETSARTASVKPEPVDLKDVPKEYHDFADVFSKSKADSLAPHRPYDLKITLEDGATPPQPPLYSLSTLELATLREFIDEHLNMGYIRPTWSSHGAPILFVKKKSGELRLCVDFRALNKIMKKDCYPLPLITDLLDAPRKARIYTKIDLCHAFHLVRVAEGDEWKTAFRTRYGSFEWQVMPFGLTNGPAVFRRFMNDVFGDLLDVCVVVYLDDILIYSDNPVKHREHICEVLRHLRKPGLFAKADKCEWHRDSVEFLGYIFQPMVLPCPLTKSKQFKIGPSLGKSKTFSLSLASPISTTASFTTIRTSPFP